MFKDITVAMEPMCNRITVQTLILCATTIIAAKVTLILIQEVKGINGMSLATRLPITLAVVILRVLGLDAERMIN